jgi:hypothetical protein
VGTQLIRHDPPGTPAHTAFAIAGIEHGSASIGTSAPEAPSAVGEPSTRGASAVGVAASRDPGSARSIEASARAPSRFSVPLSIEASASAPVFPSAARPLSIGSWLSALHAASDVISTYAIRTTTACTIPARAALPADDFDASVMREGAGEYARSWRMRR